MNELKIGCIALIPVRQSSWHLTNDRFVGLKCAKNRGLILPGGKYDGQVKHL